MADEAIAEVKPEKFQHGEQELATGQRCQRCRPGRGADEDLESLNEQESAVNVLQLADSSGLSISQTVLALQTLRDAQLVAMTGNDDAQRLVA